MAPDTDPGRAIRAFQCGSFAHSLPSPSASRTRGRTGDTGGGMGSSVTLLCLPSLFRKSRRNAAEGDITTETKMAAHRSAGTKECIFHATLCFVLGLAVRSATRRRLFFFRFYFLSEDNEHLKSAHVHVHTLLSPAWHCEPCKP